MSPEYFMHALTFYEAKLYLEGMLRRQRPLWEVARYVAFYSAAPHCKGFGWDKMGKLPWEKEPQAPTDMVREAEELAALRERTQIRDEAIRRAAEAAKEQHIMEG